MRFKQGLVGDLKIERSPYPHMKCWRILASHGLPWFDYTRTNFMAGNPDYWRIRIRNWNLVECNRKFSGGPILRRR
jgi:hypothetical protein